MVPLPSPTTAASADDDDDDEGNVPPAAIDLLGARRPAPKRPYLFGATYQPAHSKKRKPTDTGYIEDPVKRQMTTNRHLKKLERSIQMMEACTGASFVCVALPGGSSSATPRVMGRMSTALMRGIYTDPSAAELRDIVFREESRRGQPQVAAAAAPLALVPVPADAPAPAARQPLKLRHMRPGVMVKQLRALLPQPGQLPGTSKRNAPLGADAVRPEDWWPSDVAAAGGGGGGGGGDGDGAAAAADALVPVTSVRLADDYPLRKMSEPDVRCVHEAYSKYLFRREARRVAATVVKAAAAPTPTSGAAAAAGDGGGGGGGRHRASQPPPVPGVPGRPVRPAEPAAAAAGGGAAGRYAAQSVSV